MPRKTRWGCERCCSSSDPKPSDMPCIPVGIVFMEHEMSEPLLGICKHPVYVSFRNRIASCRRQGFFEDGVLLWINPNLHLSCTIDHMTSFEHRIQAVRANLGPGHHGSDFLLFDYLPINELFHIRMIQVQTHHFGSSPGRSTRLDGASRTIPNAKKRHQTRRTSPSRQRFALST